MIAELLAVKVTALELAVGLVPKLAVTPVGSPVAARLTDPVNPLPGVTVAEPAAAAPWTTETAADEDRVKLGAAATVRARFVEAVSVPLVPVMVTV